MAAHPKKGASRHAHIGFLDESGVSERPTVHRSWAPRGMTPVIPSTGSWRVRSVVGVILCTPTGRQARLGIRIFPGAISSAEVVRFLKELRRHVRGRLILLWDGLGAHRSKETTAFLAAQNHWIEVTRFPAYAPELNPVEYFWSAMKGKDLPNVCPRGLEDLDGRIRRAGRRVRRNPDLLRGFLKASGLFPRQLST